MTRFIIHIGPRKTGARYLQEAFARSRSDLMDHGVLYPPLWGERAQLDLPRRLAELDPGLEKSFTELRESGYPAVLLSAEGLSDLSAASVEYLRVLTRRNNPVRIVFHVRSWADLLPSHWKQSVKAGDTRTFREFLLAFANDPAASPIVNFAPALRRFVAQFGQRAIDVVAYDAVLAGGGDLFRHFAMTFLDWPDPPALALPPVNVSPGPGDMEVIRALHGLEKARLGHPPPRAQALAMADRYLRKAAAFPAPALRRALAAHEARAPLDELDFHIAQLHRDLFNEFREAVVEPRPLGVFFPPRRVEIPYIQRDYLLEPGVAGEVRQIHQQLLAELQPGTAQAAAKSSRAKDAVAPLA